MRGWGVSIVCFKTQPLSQAFNLKLEEDLILLLHSARAAIAPSHSQVPLIFEIMRRTTRARKQLQWNPSAAALALKVQLKLAEARAAIAVAVKV